MNDSDLSLSLYEYQTYQDWFTCVTLLLTVSFVLHSLKFRMDTSGIITLTMHLLIQVGRVVANYIESKNSFAYYALTTPLMNLMWISIYYFTLKMIEI